MTTSTKTRKYRIFDRATKATICYVESNSQDRALAAHVADTLAVELPTQTQLIADAQANVPGLAPAKGG